jgi:hypothetical protein
MWFILFVVAVLYVAVTETCKNIVLFLYLYSTFGDLDYRCNMFEHRRNSDNRFIYVFSPFFLRGCSTWRAPSCVWPFSFPIKSEVKGRHYVPIMASGVLFLHTRSQINEFWHQHPSDGCNIQIDKLSDLLPTCAINLSLLKFLVPEARDS